MTYGFFALFAASAAAGTISIATIMDTTSFLMCDLRP